MHRAHDDQVDLAEDGQDAANPDAGDQARSDNIAANNLNPDTDSRAAPDDMFEQYLKREEVPLDRYCELQDVHVVGDYSCVLTSEDISYDQLSSIRIIRMQLLERSDRRKWTFWMARGQSRHEVDEDADEAGADTTKLSMANQHVDDYFNRAEAEAKFEEKFLQYTGNKWSQKDYFKEKPGKYKLLDKFKKKQMLKNAQQREGELVKALA